MFFESISPKCEQSASKKQGFIIEALAEIIAVREYMRQHGGIPDGFDMLAHEFLLFAEPGAKSVRSQFEEARNRLVALVPPAANDFESKLAQAANDKNIGFPGWRNENCTADWRMYACFCNHAAAASDINVFLDGDLPACNSEVLNDPFYDEPVGFPKDDSYSAWWVAGAAALAALGGWLVMRKG